AADRAARVCRRVVVDVELGIRADRGAERGVLSVTALLDLAVARWPVFEDGLNHGAVYALWGEVDVPCDERLVVWVDDLSLELDRAASANLDLGVPERGRVGRRHLVRRPQLRGEHARRGVLAPVRAGGRRHRVREC